MKYGLVKDNRIYAIIATSDIETTIEKLSKLNLYNENTDSYIENVDGMHEKLDIRRIVDKKIISLKEAIDKKLIQPEENEVYSESLDKILTIDKTTQRIDDEGNIVDINIEENSIEESENTISKKDIEKQRVLSRLNQIDNESIRPLRAVVSGYATDKDKTILQSLTDEANDLRSIINDN